ncbi:MAG: AAA family ATPase [Candidatus Binatia bacterium]
MPRGELTRAATTLHAFGEFELDERLYELRRGGAVVRVEPKVFDVMAYLVTHADRVVSKDELLDRLWPGEHVSESVLPRCITVARKALGDDPTAQRMIQTVHGRGYRFVAPLQRAADAPPAADAATAATQTAFVGRVDAMAALRTAFASAEAGRGRLLLLAGEPGIGKTRTAAELASEARASGAIVLTGRCHEGEGAPAFWPWVQVLRTAARAFPATELAAALGPAAPDVAALVPELAAYAPTSAAAPTLTPAQARFRLFDGITMLLATAARTQTIVLVLDDLHWADKPSLLLLQFLTRQMRDARILVVAAYRDVELRRHHPLAGVLAELAREPHAQRVALRGLALEDVAAFVAATAGRAAPAPLISAVHAMTEGNPFFVGEIVRLLVAEGKLDRPADGTGLGIALPEGVREVIGRRLNVLSEDGNRVLGIAAVLGREFDLPVLERVAEMPGDRVLELLDEAVSARLVIPHAADAARYFFAHALVRETLYEELSTPIRVRLHRRAGAALQARYGDGGGMPRAGGGAPLAEIAHHLFEGAPGGDVEAAVTYGERAAAHALACLAYEEAAGHYERTLQALELLVPIDEARRVGVLLALGDAQQRAGDRERYRATFRRAADAARGLGRADLLARAALGFGGRLEFGLPRDDAGLALLEEARDGLGDAHPALRVRIVSRLVGAAPYSDSLAMRDALSRSAVELARRLDDPATLVVALGARAWALLGPDHVSERLAIATELVALAAETGDPNTAFLAHQMRFDANLALGEIAAADTEVAALAAVAEELAQPIERFFVVSIRAARALSDGRYDEAAALIATAEALGVRADHPVGRALTAGLALFLAHERGQVDDMEAALRFFADLYPWAERMHRVGRALAASEVGRLDDARRDFESLAGADFRDLPRDEHWLITLAQLATVCADLGDASRAASLADLLAPFADRNAVHDLLRAHAGSVAHYLARLAATREQWPEATAYFERALEQNARMGALPALTRTRHEYARMLLRRGRRNDLPKVRTMISQVLADSDALGFRRLGQEADGLAREIERGAGTRKR